MTSTSIIQKSHEEIKIIMNSVMLATVQSRILSSCLLSKNVKIKTYKTKILPVVLYGYDVWSLILREVQRLRVFEDRVLRRICGPRKDEVTGS
jgi:hypothetical protein